MSDLLGLLGQSTSLAAGVLSAAAGLLVTWGMTRGKVMELERRLGQLETNNERHLELIHSLRDVYVSREHFNEILDTIRESQRELKEDMKKILDLLTSRVV